MSKFELLLAIILLTISFMAIVGVLVWYARRNNITFVAACKVLWYVGFIGAFKDAQNTVVPLCKETVSVMYKGICAFIAWCRPPTPKHLYTEDLDCGFRMVLGEYTFAPMIPEIIYHYDRPSHISIGVYSKKLITPEISQEIVWHCSSVFQRYLDGNGLQFQYTVIPNVIDNKMQLDIFYCEHPEEYPLYSKACRCATYMSIERTCPPLPEELEVKGQGIVLGYHFDKWKSSGQVVPILWEVDRACHILVSGCTGGGKTIYVKKLIEQMAEEGSAISVLDYKNYGDYRAFKGEYYVADECDMALKKFCEDFDKVRTNGGTGDGKHHILIFDEWGAYTASKTKREFDELMKMISPLIMLGRAYKYSVCIVSQRVTVNDLIGNLREQFGVKVFMSSSISTSSATMLFPNSEWDKSQRLEEYCGFLSTPKSDLDIIITPKVDVEALDRRIEKLSSKN